MSIPLLVEVMTCRLVGTRPLTNAGKSLTGHLRTNFRGIWTKLQLISYKKINFNLPSAKWRSFCLDLIVFNTRYAFMVIVWAWKLLSGFCGCIGKLSTETKWPPYRLFYRHCTLQWRHNERDGVSNHRLSIAHWTVCSGANQRKYRRWPLWGEFTGDIPRTKGQWRGKSFDYVIMLSLMRVLKAVIWQPQILRWRWGSQCHHTKSKHA